MTSPSAARAASPRPARAWWARRDAWQFHVHQQEPSCPLKSTLPSASNLRCAGHCGSVQCEECAEGRRSEIRSVAPPPSAPTAIPCGSRNWPGSSPGSPTSAENRSRRTYAPRIAIAVRKVDVAPGVDGAGWSSGLKTSPKWLCLASPARHDPGHLPPTCWLPSGLPRILETAAYASPAHMTAREGFSGVIGILP